MTNLVMAALVWVLIHLLVSGGPLRAPLVAKLGERAYQAAFGALSVASFAALFGAYVAAKPVAVADTPSWLIAVVAGLQLFASILIVAGLSTVNPATAGMDRAIRRPDVARGMLRVTRHPFLWGMFLWSLSHLAVSRSPAAFIFFGAIGWVAVRGMWNIDHKRRLALGAAWRDFAERTSNVPFVAIMRRRQRLVFAEIGLIRVSVALALWGVAMWAHPYLGAGTYVLGRVVPG